MISLCKKIRILLSERRHDINFVYALFITKILILYMPYLLIIHKNFI